MNLEIQIAATGLSWRELKPKQLTEAGSETSERPYVVESNYRLNDRGLSKYKEKMLKPNKNNNNATRPTANRFARNEAATESNGTGMASVSLQQIKSIVK